MDTVRLEPFTSAHLGDVAVLLADPAVLRYTRVPEPPPPDFPEHWLARYEAGRQEGTCEGFAAVDAGGGFLGLALAPEIDRAARELELGYIVTPAVRGRGVATEMLRLLTRWAFDEAQGGSARSVFAHELAPERLHPDQDQDEHHGEPGDTSHGRASRGCGRVGSLASAVVSARPYRRGDTTA